MIKLPFNRCVIPTTRNFSQISRLLASAIYDPQFQSENGADRSKHQRYFGKIRGFKFQATPIIGFKYLHLPKFLLPTIEGKIDSLHHGYEISLAVKINSIVVAILITCIGGLLTKISPLLDLILAGVKTDRSLTNAVTFLLISLGLLACSYFLAWQGTKFFRKLFAKGLTQQSQDLSSDNWFEEDLDREYMSGILSQNLPFLGRNVRK
jgi:hypothetical protein